MVGDHPPLEPLTIRMWGLQEIHFRTGRALEQEDSLASLGLEDLMRIAAHPPSEVPRPDTTTAGNDARHAP